MVTAWHWEPSSCFLFPGKKVSLPGVFQGAAAEPTRATEPRPMLWTSCLPTIQEGKVRLVPVRSLHPGSGSPDCKKGGAATMAWGDFLGEEF